MKWVTRDYVHIDRVASPWLIRRFVDPDAQFVLLPSADPGTPPDDAIAFGLPGVELSAHDADGSAFRKIMRKYDLSSPALDMLADLVEDAIGFFLDEKLRGGGDITKLRFAEAPGLVALSEGMLYAMPNDQVNLDRSMAIYDALYAFCQVKLLERQYPEEAKGAPFKMIPVLRQRVEPPRYPAA